MLTREAIDRELDKYRSRLISHGILAKFRPGGLDVIVRMFMEELIFLRDEVPDDRLAELDYLIDRYEVLVKSLAH